MSHQSSQPPTDRRFNPVIRSLILFIGYWAVILIVYTAASAILGEAIKNPVVENLMRFALFLVYFGFIAALTKYVDRRPLRVLQLTLDRNAMQWFVITTAITGVVVLGGTALANALFPSYLGEPRQIESWHLFNGFMAAFFLQGFPEELAFRGYLSQTLNTTPKRTFAITSLVFMVLHVHFLITPIGLIASGDPNGLLALGDGIVQMLYPLVFGAFAFLMMYLHRTVWAAVAVHFGIHFFRVIGEIMGLASGTLVTIIFDVLFALLTAYVFFKNREAFNPEHNRLVYN